MGNDFINLTTKVWGNLDYPIKSYDFSQFWLISCMPPSQVALCYICDIHRVIYLKETRVRTTHAARKMLLCRLEAAKRHLNPGKIFALARISPRSIRSVCVFSPLTWLVIIDNSLCVCVCVCVCFSLGLGWLLLTLACVCIGLGWLLCVCVCVLFWP